MEKKYHTIIAVPKYGRKIVESETKSMPVTHIYLTTHFLTLCKHLSKISGGLI